MSKFKRMFFDYVEAKGLYTDKDQLAIHKLPYTIFWEGKPDILVDLISMGKLNKRK